MTDNNQMGVLESLLFAAGDEGLSVEQLVQVMGITHIEVLNLLEAVGEDYRSKDSRGLTLLETAGSFQLATKKEHADYLRKLVEIPDQSTLSQASLETLAIIAYRQPITRMEIDEIRGVHTDGPIRTLVAKGLVKDHGRAEGAGRAKLYVTTDEFLDSFGLKSLAELPQLEDQAEELEQTELDLFFDRFNQKQREEEK
ncbi:Segregation and condensation protein B [Listeria grayi]|uniref:Segregation and condensation protein B n=3 Tax=Listeria grayi TaxID=1641 RepID=D7UXW2_LISGR|nr:segregation and condensation protein B [Listeria grayi DSM 20601]EUJ27154.1 segregation and condensation protein B [Listeria grayi FSL F6-1183]STY45626.1 Segregation and condensation protein B [Listeria grayi]VEI32745.1 Segregation and condensation protein B [Listeria grayi]